MKLLFFIFSIFVGTRLIAMEAPQASSSSLNNHKMIDATKKESSVRNLKDLAIPNAASHLADILLNGKIEEEEDTIDTIRVESKIAETDPLFQTLKNAVKRKIAQKVFVDEVFPKMMLHGIQIKTLGPYVATINNFEKEKNFFLNIYFLGMVEPKLICQEKLSGCNKVQIDRISNIDQKKYELLLSCGYLRGKQYYSITASDDKCTKTKLEEPNKSLLYLDSTDQKPLLVKDNEAIFNSPTYHSAIITKDKQDKDSLVFRTKKSPRIDIGKYKYTDPKYLGNHSIVTDQSGKKILISTATGERKFYIDGNFKKISENVYLLNKRDNNKNDILLIFDEYILPKEIDLSSLKIKTESIKKAFIIQPNPITIPNNRKVDGIGREPYLLKKETQDKQRQFFIIHQDSGENIFFDLSDLNKIKKYELPKGNVYRVSAFSFIIITPENLIPKVIFFEDIEKISQSEKISISEAFLPSFIEKNLKNENQWQFFMPHVMILHEEWEELKKKFKIIYAICTTQNKEYLIPLIPNNLSFKDIIEIGENLHKENSSLIKKLEKSNYLLWECIKDYNRQQPVHLIKHEIREEEEDLINKGSSSYKNSSHHFLEEQMHRHIDMFNKYVKKHGMPTTQLLYSSLPIDDQILPETIDDRALLKEKKVEISKEESEKLNTIDASKIINDEAEQKTVRLKSIPIRNQTSQTNRKKRELHLPELEKKGPISNLWQKARQLWDRYFRKRTN